MAAGSDNHVYTVRRLVISPGSVDAFSEVPVFLSLPISPLACRTSMKTVNKTLEMT